MNKILYYHIIRMAGPWVCLFLLFQVQSNAQSWKFDETGQKAYDMTLNLNTNDALALIANPKSAQDHYITSLSETIELLITENPEKFNEYEDHFEARMDDNIKGSTADFQFLQAEMRLQWAFIYLKFGHEFDAALRLRQAYQIADECRRKNPKYLPIRKTTGLLEIIIGSVPEKYNWVLGLLGMEGAIQQGLDDLNLLRTSGSPLAFEADVLYALIQGFIFQQPDSAMTEIKKLQAIRPDNRLVLFLGASIAIKNHESETALTMLKTLRADTTGLPLYYADYLRGEVYLHKADYLNSISAYRWFLNHQPGSNYIKDAYYKIGLCYWLNGNVNDAIAVFKEARTKGREATEADKHASRSLAEKSFPNIKLSKARYYTDGGYYPEARRTLDAITPEDLPTNKDKVEYYYRKARLEHTGGQIPAAKIFYQQTIDMSGEESWYFAPNACLQMGYIFLSEKNRTEAKNYFTKALRYKKHEYKNSIDSKAKTALAQIKDK